MSIYLRASFEPLRVVRCISRTDPRVPKVARAVLQWCAKFSRAKFRQAQSSRYRALSQEISRSREKFSAIRRRAAQDRHPTRQQILLRPRQFFLREVGPQNQSLARLKKFRWQAKDRDDRLGEMKSPEVRAIRLHL